MGELRQYVSEQVRLRGPLGAMSHMTVEQIDALPFGAARREAEMSIQRALEQEYIALSDVPDAFDISMHHLRKVRGEGIAHFSEGNRIYLDREELRTAIAVYKGAGKIKPKQPKA